MVDVLYVYEELNSFCSLLMKVCHCISVDHTKEEEEVERERAGMFLRRRIGTRYSLKYQHRVSTITYGISMVFQVLA